jgi:hypothetical protein
MFLGAIVGAALVVRGHLLAALVLLSAILAVLAAAYAVVASPRPADGAA